MCYTDDERDTHGTLYVTKATRRRVKTTERGLRYLTPVVDENARNLR